MQPLMLNNWIYCAKEFLLRVPVVLSVNQLLKAHQLRTGLRILEETYAERARAIDFVYSESTAIGNFQRNLVAAKPNTYPKQLGDLRIFWVGSNRDQDESGFLQALRRMGRVIEFTNWKGGYGQWYWDDHGRVSIFDDAIVALNDQSLLFQIENALKEGSIDIVLGQMWANFISKEALQRIRSYGIPIINISMDDRLPDNWRVQRGIRLGAAGLAAVTDLVLTTASETCLWYGVEGCPAMFWPLASDPDVFKPNQDIERDIDVLFIGNKYGIRENIIRHLKKRGINVECYGAGWLNGPSTAEQSAALFKRAKIILGVGTVGYCYDVFTLKLRDFDAPMSGGLYLTHRCVDLSKIYKEGIEIECYSDAEEAAKKIQYYLDHPFKLREIAMAGNIKAQNEHTWNQRLLSTFMRLGLIKRE
jgi:spore maturation protein CgeB